MVRIHFAGVAGHGFRHAENIGAAGAQKTVPEPHIGSEFGVVPGVASDVVTPGVPCRIVSVHHVAVVQKAVPTALLDLFAVKLQRLVELVFHRALQGRGAVRQTPYAKCGNLVQMFGAAHQARRLGIGLCLFDGVVPRGHGARGIERQFAGAPDAVGCAESRLRILITGLQGVIACVVEPQVHGRGVWRPEPDHHIGGR